MKVTIADVAKHAGVSIATVSRFINGQYQFMSIKTRDRVQQVIKDIGYIPNSLAQGLKNQRTQVVGVLISNISHPFWSTVLDAIELTCREHGYSVLFCNAQDDPDLERHYMTMLQTKQVDGIIVNPTGHEVEKFTPLVEVEFPLITLDRKLETLGIPSVAIDNVYGARQATEHLLSFEHKRIGVVLYELNGLSNRIERLKGYKETLEKAGIPFDENLVVYVDPKTGSGKRKIQKLFQLSEPPTAVFSTSLLLNVEVLSALNELQIRIPEDVSFVGYDDAIWMSLLTPAITTIFQPSYQMGVFAAKRLIHQIEGIRIEDSLSTQLTPKLIVRSSCERVTVYK